jgi:DNA-binding PadR family transcriptional regulator
MAYGPGMNQDEEENRVTVEMLYRELSSGGSREIQSPSNLLDEVSNALFPDQTVDLDESVVKGNLDAVLLALVATQDHNTHGKGLMETLSTVFGAEFSPGTVYPSLHNLEEDVCLETRELVRTKEYAIDDTDASRERVAAAARQHLLIGAFLQQVAKEL